MSLYNYKVKDKVGSTKTGRMDGENPSIIAEKLKEMHYTIIDISEQSQSLFSIDLGERFGFIGSRDKIMLNVKLASLLRAGVPLMASLASLKEQTGNKRLRKVIDNMHRNVMAGNSLSQSFSLYPGIFPELLVNITEAGEVSGKLTEVLERYAGYTERQASFRQTIISALTYPCLLIIAAIGLGAIFLMYLLPKFVDLFNKLNVVLPLPTQILVKIGNFFSNYSLHVIIGAIVLIIFLKIFASLKRGRRIVDNIKLRFPYTGKLTRKISITRFARTLGTLYASGVPILKSIEISRHSTGNTVFADAISKLKDAIAKGRSFSSIMQDNPLFPSDMAQMVSVGEQTGNLNEMLYKIADFYEQDIDYAMKNISALIEPVIILTVGIVVGFLAFSVIMPIFNLMQAM